MRLNYWSLIIKHSCFGKYMYNKVKSPDPMVKQRTTFGSVLNPSSLDKRLCSNFSSSHSLPPLHLPHSLSVSITVSLSTASAGIVRSSVVFEGTTSFQWSTVSVSVSRISVMSLIATDWQRRWDNACRHPAINLILPPFCTGWLQGEEVREKYRNLISVEVNALDFWIMKYYFTLTH